MFLMRPLTRRMAAFGGRERGSAMIAVLGVMAVASSIAVTTTSVSMHAVGYTTSTRAGVQAEAAAEAGIDFAAASLATSVCQSQYSNSTAPIFSVTVSYSTLQTSPGDTDTSWVSGCPTTASAQRLKLVSTGTANALGLAGNSSENVRKVEAIFPYIYTPSPDSNAIIPSGPAIFSYAQIDPTINNLTVTQASTTRPSIQYLTGSATCTSGTTITGDVILGSGALSVTSGCTINGDLWASNVVNIQSGEVTGNVHAKGEGSDGGDSVSLSNSSTVDGNVYSDGPGTFDGKVGGNVVSGPTRGDSKFNHNSSVGGSVVTAGTVTASAGTIKGTVSTNQNGVTTPTIPVVPNWIDYAYSASDWKTSSGSAYTVLTLTSCSSSTLASALITVQNSANPIILDTRVCGAVTDLRNYNLALKSDTVILTNGFKLSSNDIESSDATDKRLWMITPDSSTNQTPNCPVNSSATIGNHVTVGNHIGAMIYTPCAISNSGDVWRGQMYASSVGSSSSFTLNFLPIGLPTVNLSTGQILAPPGTGVLGGRTSIRDLTVG
jgi:hypothetical protein